MTAPRAPLRTLIDAAGLRAMSADETSSPVVLDASFDLADPAAGERAYAEAHIAGARHVHLDRDLSTAKTGRNGRHPLPARAAFAATVGRLGIAPGTPVVVYDRQRGVFAARLWWMLRWLGHADVAVLDGGFAAWRAGGGDVAAGMADTEVPTPHTAPYPERASLVGTVDTEALLATLDGAFVVDARAPARFRGEVEPLDLVAGHIPGAANRPFDDNLDAEGRFRPAAELRDAFEALLGQRAPAEAIHSCGSGVTACHNLLAMEHAGLPGARLYPGSWSEWSSDPERPVARG